MDNLFYVLTEKGNPKQAIRWADKRLHEQMAKQPAEIDPGTTVQKLAKELAKYFPEELKGKYIDEKL